LILNFIFVNFIFHIKVYLLNKYIKIY